MKRTTPLRRGKSLQVRVIPARVPRPRAKRAPAPARNRVAAAQYSALRLAVYERESGRCACCDGDLSRGFEAHHRKLRSQGGQDDLANLVALLPECHARVHAHPAYARTAGFIVRRGSDPAQVALHLWDGRVVRLDQDGGYDLIFDAA